MALWGIVAAASAALYGVLLVVFRPASPYEWDEVLFLDALDRYDVGAHSPHPPGYPVYVAAGRLVRWVVRDPQLALELVAVAAALAGFWFLWRAAKELGAPPAAAFTASAIVALTPAFAFNANVGLSDVPGAAAAAAAVWWAVRSRREPRHLPVTAALTAVALGVRPQLILAVLVPGLLALWPALRNRRWRPVLLAAGSGIAVLLACWVPAVLVTGPSRFFGAVLGQARWAAQNEAGYHLPGAPLGLVLEHWLLLPFGSTEMAAVFWLLVVAGTIAWLRSSRGELVLVAAGWGGVYLVMGMLTLSFTTSVRYIVPALPPLALLAAGVVVASARPLRRAGAALCVAWCVAVVAWGAPVYALRREPAPAWAALEWIARTYPPAKTTVVFQGLINRHAPYVLRPRGFTLINGEQVQGSRPECGEDSTVLNVGAEIVPGGTVVFSREWRSGRLRRLTRNRYNTCAVMVLQSPKAPPSLPGWSELARGAEIGGRSEAIVLPGTRPAVVRVCAAADPAVVRRQGSPPVPVAAGQCADVAVLAGSAASLSVNDQAGHPSPAARVYLLPLGELAPASGPSPALVIPQVAHVPGRGGSFWRTDLVLINPSNRSLELSARLLWAGPIASGPTPARGTLAAGGVMVVRDVLALPEFVGTEGVGAALVYALEAGRPCRRADCSFLAWARTYDSVAKPEGWRAEEWLPGVAPDYGFRGGQKATFSPIGNDAGVRSTVGAASLSTRPVRVRIRVLTPSGELVEEGEHEVGSFGHLRTALQAGVAGGRVEVEAVDPPRDARLFPYVSSVDQVTGRAAYLLPDGLRVPHLETRRPWRFPLPPGGP